MKVFGVLARALLGEYELYRVLELSAAQQKAIPPVPDGQTNVRALRDVTELHTARTEEIRALAHYDAADARCFVAEDRQSGSVVAACWFWFGSTYVRRNFWPLQNDEAKLVQITVDHAHRNLGIAQQLLQGASRSMFNAGFVRLYARVWHSHKASLAAFKKAGWRQIAVVFTLKRFRKTFQLVVPYRAPQRHHAMVTPRIDPR